ncbi:MAG: PEP-CTERM sorting domain-containing protein [Planctomycetaceae bacterium]|nr:PEP-CTERM sorting domain-containing protein [Planctomycetaceae bacterium]
MRRSIVVVLLAVLLVSATSLAQLLYAVDSSRGVLSDGTNLANTVKADSSKLSVRGDAKAAKSWIEFDLRGIDVASLTSAQLRITLHAAKDNTCKLSAVNDNVTSGLVALDGTLTWNNAPGNITSADGVNPDNTSYTVTDLQKNLDPALTTLIGTVDYSAGSGGVAGQQYFMDVLSILQADTDGFVLFVLHGAGGDTSFATHDHASGAAEYYPALVLVPEPATLVLLGIGGLLTLRKRS